MEKYYHVPLYKVGKTYDSVVCYIIMQYDGKRYIEYISEFQINQKGDRPFKEGTYYVLKSDFIESNIATIKERENYIRFFRMNNYFNILQSNGYIDDVIIRKLK